MSSAVIGNKLTSLRAIYNTNGHEEQCCTADCKQFFFLNDLEVLCLNLHGLSFESATAFLSGMVTSFKSKSRTPNTNAHIGRPDLVQTHTKYQLGGTCVCRSFFEKALGVSRRMMGRIFKRSKEMFTDDFEGFSERRGGNRESHAISAEIAKELVHFLDTIADQYGLADPGRHPGRNDYGMLVQLPHELSKTKLYTMYSSEMEENGIEKVSYPSFKKIWEEVRPFLRVLPLRSDMCSTCSRFQSKLRYQLLTCPAGSAADIDETMRLFRKHREDARKAREFYNTSRQKAIESYKNRSVIDGKEHLSTLMLSIDFAENLEVPSHTDQDGSLFFKSPSKVGIFGVVDEGAKEYGTFLLPEKRTLKKSGSAVASMVFEYLKRRNATFDNLVIFADNAASQNKNQYLYSLTSLLAIKSLFKAKNVRVCFMVVGHTKFGPDRIFGVFRRKFKNVDINTILDVEELILATFQRDDASALGVNGHAHVPFFTHCPFDGTPEFKSYNCKWLADNYFKPLVGHSLWSDIKILKQREFTMAQFSVWRPYRYTRTLMV